MPLIDLKHIKDNPYQPRMGYPGISELARRIKANKDSLPETLGLIHVPNGRLVGYRDDGTKFNLDPAMFEQVAATSNWAVELAEGHRRFRAFQALATELKVSDDGQHFIDLTDLDYNQMPVNLVCLDDTAMDTIAWDENAQRRDLNPVEEARALAKTMQDFKLTQEQVATRRGLGRSTVANKVRLLKLPPDMLEAVERGHLSEKTALAFLPALDIKPHLMEQAHPPLSKDPHFGGWQTPTPNTLKRRLLAADLPAMSAEQVRQIVERIEQACVSMPCEKCGADLKKIRFVKDGNTNYCESCWKELTTERYCVHCLRSNIVKLTDIETGAAFECWFCRRSQNAAEMLDKEAKFGKQKAFTAHLWQKDEPRPASEPKQIGAIIEEMTEDLVTRYCPECGTSRDFEPSRIKKQLRSNCHNCHKIYPADEWLTKPPINNRFTDDEIAKFIDENGPWNMVEAQYKCQACLADYPHPARAWKSRTDFYLCPTCYAAAGYWGECPHCEHSYKVHPKTIANGFGLQCPACGKVSPAAQWLENEPEYCVYPCHLCGQQKIVIHPALDKVECSHCGNEWDSIAEYHTERTGPPLSYPVNTAAATAEPAGVDHTTAPNGNGHKPTFTTLQEWREHLTTRMQRILARLTLENVELFNELLDDVQDVFFEVTQ